MAKNDWKIAKEAIEEFNNIFIFHHIRPDGDCLNIILNVKLTFKK